MPSIPSSTVDGRENYPLANSTPKTCKPWLESRVSHKNRLTKSATRNRVLADLKAAAGRLKKGDIFFLTYSGHGGQVYNTGNDFEPDGYDETWCLYDGELIDDELYAAFAVFAAGVRIFVFPTVATAARSSAK